MSEGNGLATADQIRTIGQRAVRRQKTLGPCPVSKLVLRIRSLTEAELSRFEMAVVGSARTGGMRASRLEDAKRRLFVLCLVDANGDRILGDKDAECFKGWDSVDTNYLYEQCSAFCGTRQDDIEGLVGNSEGVQLDSEPSVTQSG